LIAFSFKGRSPKVSRGAYRRKHEQIRLTHAMPNVQGSCGIPMTRWAQAKHQSVFAGSSEATLRRMFGRSTEPFYNWAPPEPFELPGEDFVQAMVAKVNRLSQYPLALKDALTTFDALQRTPEFTMG
jgi:hypothetical protein